MLPRSPATKPLRLKRIICRSRSVFSSEAGGFQIGFEQRG